MRNRYLDEQGEAKQRRRDSRARRNDDRDARVLRREIRREARIPAGKTFLCFS